MANGFYQVKLSHVFEGPMDLLVHLINKNEVDIYDIPIAQITDQYLEYIDLMKSMNIDFAGDFIIMAATLTHIKSKMLIPSINDREDEDPRLEIARPLLEYLRMKSAAELLVGRNILGQDTFAGNINKKDYIIKPEDEIIDVGLFELIDAFQKILKNIPVDYRLDFTGEKISVKDKISEIISILEVKGSVTFFELFSANVGKSEIVATFLAILEIVKLDIVRIVQYAQTGIIRLFYL